MSHLGCFAGQAVEDGSVGRLTEFGGVSGGLILLVTNTHSLRTGHLSDDAASNMSSVARFTHSRMRLQMAHGHKPSPFSSERPSPCQNSSTEEVQTSQRTRSKAVLHALGCVAQKMGFAISAERYSLTTMLQVDRKSNRDQWERMSEVL